MRQAQALTALMEGRSCFLTGPPGAGKSYVVRQFVELARKSGKVVSVTASTGMAATHIFGMTIHSWSGIGVRSSLTSKDIEQIASKDLYARRLLGTDVLVIDEVSMLSGEFLDMLDVLLSEVRGSSAPFGDVQMVLVGDMFQLPPVQKGGEAQFAFSSSSWRNLDPDPCYLTEQHRQGDDELREILEAMRRGELRGRHKDMLSSRVGARLEDASLDPPRLYSHHVDVDKINQRRLLELAGESRFFTMKYSGSDQYLQQLLRGVLAPQSLELKLGAEVMFVANHPLRLYVNGSLGRVVDLKDRFPVVEMANDKRCITVEPVSWQVEEEGVVRAEIRQIPLALAWAITIHKSQGMSLDAAEIDLSRAFTFGMGYVALSRVRRLSGLILRGFNDMALRLDPRVFEFDQTIARRAKSLEVELTDYQLEQTRPFDSLGSTEPVDRTLLEDLKRWRRNRAISDEVPPYVVAPDVTLEEIAATLPATDDQLAKVRGMGTLRVAQYSREILAVVERWRYKGNQETMW